MNEAQLTNTPKDPVWRLREKIDRIYGHMPDSFYIESANPLSAKCYLDTIVYDHNEEVLELGETLGIDVVTIFAEIFENEEMLEYFLTHMRSMAIAKGLINLEKQKAEEA